MGSSIRKVRGLEFHGLERRNPRVSGIEKSVWWHRLNSGAQYDSVRDRLGAHGSTVEMFAADLFESLRHRVRYEKDRESLGFDGELIRGPLAVLARGGDCEDLNLSLLGGTISRCFSPSFLASAYCPDVAKARHVWLAIQSGSGWIHYDLCPPALSGGPRFPQFELVPWLLLPGRSCCDAL